MNKTFLILALFFNAAAFSNDSSIDDAKTLLELNQINIQQYLDLSCSQIINKEYDLKSKIDIKKQNNGQTNGLSDLEDSLIDVQLAFRLFCEYKGIRVKKKEDLIESIESYIKSKALNEELNALNINLN